MRVYFDIHQVFCLITTVFLHDAFLSVFMWMGVEAIHLYRMVVLVYGADRDLKYIYLALGWGKY